MEINVSSILDFEDSRTSAHGKSHRNSLPCFINSQIMIAKRPRRDAYDVYFTHTLDNSVDDLC